MKAVAPEIAGERVDRAKPVLPGAAWPAGATIPMPLWGDSVWNLWPLVTRTNACPSTASARFEEDDARGTGSLMRDLVYARLNYIVPPRRRLLTATGLGMYVLTMRMWVTFLWECRGHRSFGDVDHADYDAFHAHLRATRNAKEKRIRSILDVACDAFFFAEFLPDGGVRIDPWKGKLSVIRNSVGTTHECSTPRIPTEIFGPLLKWAFKYVEEFADDIYAARAELEVLRARNFALSQSDSVHSAKVQRQRRLQRLKQYLSQLHHEGRGIPVWCDGWYGDVVVKNESRPTGRRTCFPMFDLIVGLRADQQGLEGCHTRPRWCQLIEAAAAQLGEHPGGLISPITGRLQDGSPWIRGFDPVSLRVEEQMLQAACYVICAALTGMRDSELQSMRIGAVRTETSLDGLVTRHKFVGRVFKGSTANSEVEWVTIPAAARAVAALERQVLLHNSDAEWLWAPVRRRKLQRQVVGPKISKAICGFAQHLNRRFGNGTAIIPTENGKVWQFSSRQFRRTSAWFIGNRPFGVVAGKIQYKHASIAAFEGYAGDTASGFPQEVERERALGQMDDLLDHFDQNRDGAELLGGAAPRLKRLFAQAVIELGPLPGMHADRPRLRAMLKSTAKTLHVGILADCFFDPHAALCLASVPLEDRLAPETGLCQPTRCTNACIAKKHVPVWEEAMKETRGFLAQKRLSEVQRAALRRDAEAIGIIIECHSVS